MSLLKDAINMVFKPGISLFFRQAFDCWIPSFNDALVKVFFGNAIFGGAESHIAHKCLAYEILSMLNKSP